VSLGAVDKLILWLQVLCELQVAMLERGIQPEQDISREIMGSDIRDIQDTSYRNLRDWYIYRYVLELLLLHFYFLFLLSHSSKFDCATYTL
jgi:hypothetical protein